MNRFASTARARMGRARAGLRHNLGLKVGSVVFACLVWYATNVLERDAERVVDVPVVPRHVPTRLTVVDAPTTPLAITLRGPRTLLEGVEEARLKFVLPARELVEGTNRVDLQAGHIEPELPRRLRIVRLQPARIELRTERLVGSSVPVRVELAGKPAFGYSVSEIQVAPEKVAVAGPKSVVDQLRVAQTVPIDVQGADGDVTRAASLEWAGDYVQFEPDRVTATVHVEPVVITREFRDVPVRVLGAPGATVTPPTLQLTLRATQRELTDFEMPADAATVDATGLPPGTHEVEVTVEMPRSVEVVTRTPEVHRLVVPEPGNARP